MSYLVQQTRVSSLTVAGEDVTDRLVSFTVSDASADRNGIITTTGTVVLGQTPGGDDITSYRRREYKRGARVILDMVEPGGAVYRHPRGYLYVMSSLYNTGDEQLIIEVGCRLSLAFLTDEPDDLLPLVPIPLDANQQTIENASASFISAGQILWQDNQGNLQSGRFFGNDNTSSVEPGKWVSVLGVTAIDARPAASSGAIPDEIDLSYSVPAGLLDDDGTGRVDTTTTTSNYFVDYPAINYQRIPEGGVGTGTTGSGGRIFICTATNCGGFSDDGACNGSANCTTTGTRVAAPSNNTLASSTRSSGFTRFPPAPSGGCGNTPLPPGGSSPDDPNRDPNQPPPVSCDELWETVNTPTYLPATRVSTSRTEYGAVGAQVSRVYDQEVGPAVEANNQYWSDKFAYCRNLYGRACVPNGDCEYEGMVNILQSYSEQINYYGTANELVRTVTDTYYTTLSAAEPHNWRSGIESGVAIDFQTLSLTDMYRANRTVVEYWQEDNVNYEKTTNYDSLTTRNSGISGGSSVIDALNGIVTTSLRASTTTSTNPLRPDSVNSGTTNTEEKTTKLLLSVRPEYLLNPDEAGPYISEESIPSPLLFATKPEIEEVVGHYSEYITRMTVGQTRAVQVGEALRSEIITDWRPGMPFRFVDEGAGMILGMRMDACAWGVTQEESGVVTVGIWTGESLGIYNPGVNVVGNATPSLDGGSSTPPANLLEPPTITDDVIAQSFAYQVDVEIQFAGWVDLYGNDGIVPPAFVPAEARYQGNLMITCGGQVVAPGGLLSPEGNGGVPISGGSSLLIQGATIVTADLFGAT